jgi:hypothetical protein
MNNSKKLLFLTYQINNANKIQKSLIATGVTFSLLYLYNYKSKTNENNKKQDNIKDTDNQEKIETEINNNIEILKKNVNKLKSENKTLTNTEKFLIDFVYSSETSMNRQVNDINGMLAFLNIMGHITKINNKFIYKYIDMKINNTNIQQNIKKLNNNMQKLLDILLTKNIIKVVLNNGDHIFRVK